MGISLRNWNNGSRFGVGNRERSPALLGICVLSALILQPRPAQAIEDLTLQTALQAPAIDEGSGADIPQLSDLEQPATTIEDWIAQISQALVQVTGVRVEVTESGLQVVLDVTEGELPTPTMRSVGNAWITDFPDAVLAVPDGEEFSQANPIEGIALVSVTSLPGDRVRVAITGVNAPPMVDVREEGQEFVLSVVPGTEGAGTDQDAIQVVVTAEQDEGYNPSRATTATRTDTPLRDIPASITVIPRQVIEDQGAVRLDEILRNASGVTFSSSFGNRGQDFRIRGFGATQFRNGLREDAGGGGSFVNRTAQETANIERVEVLRGPASVLFGQGEPGGVINLVSKSPLTVPYYDIEFTAGNFNFYRPTLDFSGPLTDDGALAYRLNLVYEDTDSFRDFADSRRYFIAPTLAWRMGADTTLTLEASYLQDRRTFDRGLIVLNGDDRPADLPLNRALFDPRFSASNFDETRAYLYFDHEFSDNLSIRSAFRYTTSFESDREGTSNAIGLLDDNRTVELESYFGDQRFETYTFQNDLVWGFDTGSIAHTLLIGLELASNNARFTSQAPAEQQALTGGLLDIFDPDYDAITYTGGYQFTFDGNRQNQRTLGIYVQDQINILDNLIVLLGGRFDSIDSEERFGDFSQNSNDNAFSPRVGLVYQPNATLSLYASYARSFVPEAGRSADNTPFEPTRGTQYEIGIKADFLDGRLSTTLAAYDITRSNITTLDPDNPNFSIQVGEQRDRGIDFDIAGEILPGWNIIAGYSYLDASITRDNTFEVGNRLNNAPRNSASLWTTYTIQSGDLRGLGFGAGIFFVDQRAGDLANSFTLPSYTRFDAALYYNRDNFRAALNFKNLFDTEYFAGSQSRFAVVPGAPFEVRGTVSWQF
ncbi:TonB-dependent siderophore receptor [Thermocoleostomius sinensis]|uniref:TonB-dependent siderophore receptor n=1 Tax=Thermocoleostomius sinensis A174 TaxID=2016057 RepID=A0A9E9CAY9_9CYAN|nr:TonB-dependent siderophore receptor [Thermocoleostomius sinensis]WAL59540.1 TonB-dependent siderophore receptor [Thermocoleostomius sinensis A174]